MSAWAKPRRFPPVGAPPAAAAAAAAFLLIFLKIVACAATGSDKLLFDGLNTQFLSSKQPLQLEIPIDKIPPLDEDQYFEPIPYALSTTYLTHLARNEEALHESLINYKADLEERLELINKYTKDYESSAIKGTAHVPTDSSADPWDKARLIAAHPLNAYRMIRRLSKEFDRLAKHIWELNLERDLGRIVSGLGGVSGWPKEADHADTLEALLRLHHIYNFNLSEFTAGNFFGTQARPTSTSAPPAPAAVGLTSAQTFEIAEYAMTQDYFTLAMDWLKVTEEKILQDEAEYVLTDEFNDITPRLKMIQNAKWRNKVKHDRDYQWHLTSKNYFLYTDKINNTSPEKLTTWRDYNYLKVKQLARERQEQEKTQQQQEQEQDQQVLPESSQLRKSDAEYFNFLALCNGENFQTEKVKSQLYCWYEHDTHPYFAINPLKAELLSEEPYLVQIYEFISNEWIENLQVAALPTLKRAPSSTFKATTHRTAAYAWLLDEDIPHVPLARRIELATGLVVRGDLASTPLQIASYAFGGHVATHYDSLNELDPFDNTITMKGNRVATFLIYLNDVEVGGLTAFPVLGTSVRPVKGSAVLWYTAKLNGGRDDRMLHGACPTIVGQKWIATKWVHLHENFLTRPCALHHNL